VLAQGSASIVSPRLWELGLAQSVWCSARAGALVLPAASAAAVALQHSPRDGQSAARQASERKTQGDVAYVGKKLID
jgi:hypothetical protein